MKSLEKPGYDENTIDLYSYPRLDCKMNVSLLDLHGLSVVSSILYTQVAGHLTRKSEVLGLIPGLSTFRFSFCCFKRGSCQLLAKVCARSTG